MTEADLLRQRLVTAQNSDGGWGYDGSGKSWTEPTALALLALASADQFDPCYLRGYNWLVVRQRSDGGWSPNDLVPTSTWVTNLAFLALADGQCTACRRRSAKTWLLNQSSAPSNPVTRLIMRTRRIGMTFLPSGGSPWYPGTAAWVGPTSLAILAAASRRCSDGGWNHGGSTYRSENAFSYPEMTGLALLGLANGSRTELLMSIKRAHEYELLPESVEGLSWLQLGLTSLDEDFDNRPTALPCRTMSDVSLRLLAITASSPKNQLIAASRL